MKEIEQLKKNCVQDISNSNIADKIIELINVVNEQREYILQLEGKIKTLEHRSSIKSIF
jgi:hypothetical protein